MIIPGDKPTRQARVRAHNAFDPLWQVTIFVPKPRMSRRAAYAWMQRAMGLGAGEAHIGMFNEEQCEKLIRLVEAKFKEGPRAVQRDQAAEEPGHEAAGDGVQVPDGLGDHQASG